MTAQQRDMIDQILRNAPFDLGGDVAAQRPLLDQMLTSQPLPADVRVTAGDLGGIPVTFIDIADTERFSRMRQRHEIAQRLRCRFGACAAQDLSAAP